jgi:hypothetical protein
MKNTLIVIGCLFQFFVSNAQSVFYTDNLHFKFDEYDFKTNKTIDHRQDKGGLAFDIYNCLVWNKASKEFFVGMEKYQQTIRILKYNPTTKKFTNIVTTGLKSISAIDIDYKNNQLYFIDGTASKIFKSNLDGSATAQFGTAQTFLTGWTPVIAVDEVGDRLFFTTGGGFVFYSNLTTFKSVEMPASNVYIAGGRVGDIVIDDKSEFMYWTYNLSLEPSSINKTDMKTLKTTKIKSAMESFNNLSIDADRLFWTTTGSILQSIDFNGGNQVKHYTPPAGIYMGDMNVINGTPTAVIEPLLKLNDIIISPNPGLDFINIDLSDNKVDFIKIFNTDGKEIFAQKVNDDEEKINLNSGFLNSGLYLISFFNNERILITKQFLKN